MPKYHNIELSAIIVHYSAISQRYDTVWWNRNKQLLISLMQQYQCTKILIPQDEYNYNGNVREFISKAGIQYIYTCAYKEDYEKLYPKILGYTHIETVYTGYIDEVTLKKIQKKGYGKKRTIDIGYRARKLPYWLGKHGQLKYELAEVFLDYFKTNSSNLTYDIANTSQANSNQNVLLGDSWIDYLLNCRTVLGCLGGSGLLDIDGNIAKKVNKYCNEHPNASFEEVEKKCFKGKDNEIHLFALSPRHFECAMTKTCQILVEGNYNGVFESNIDYIELKKDFSNIAEVISKVQDIKYCEQIAENCYNHVVLSGKYTYAKYVENIIRKITKIENGIFSFRLWFLCKKSKFRSVHYIPSFSFLKSFPKELGLWLLGKIFKLFEPFRNTTLHKSLKHAWDEYCERHAQNDSNN